MLVRMCHVVRTIRFSRDNDDERLICSIRSTVVLMILSHTENFTACVRRRRDVNESLT